MTTPGPAGRAHAAVGGTDPVAAVVALLAAARRRGPRAGTTTVVAIDGPSGAGKTALAERLLTAIADLVGHPEESGPTIVHMDDLYPGWDGLAEAVPLLVERILAPLAAGRPGSYQRYDWERGTYAESHPVPSGGWVVVEGVGCGSRAAAPYLSALAWVDAPRDVRRRRGLDRDGETYRPHWDRWQAQERALFARERTSARADVLFDSRDRASDNDAMADSVRPNPDPVRKGTDAAANGAHAVGVDEAALRDAVVEMTHAQGDGISTRLDGAAVVVTRRTEFLRVTTHPDGGLELQLSFPAGAPGDDRLRDLPGGWRSLRVAPTDVDADLLALEPLIEAAYAQNG